MSDEQENESYRLIAWILGIAVTIALVTAIIPGILAGFAGTPPVASTPQNSTAAPAGLPVTVAGPVKLYFATGKATLPETTPADLTPVVEAVKAAKATRVLVSGFHDKTGNPEQNAELAKQRAMAVRQALTEAGITESQVELRKPQETEGTGDNQEARRVEVTAVK